VDWHEVWSREYWREYLGRAGAIGHGIQRLCARVPQRAFCFSRLHAERLEDEGLRGSATVLPGEFDGPLDRPDPEPAEPVVVFAGRHIPEKRVDSLVEAMAVLRSHVPELRCEIFGDGPERPRVEALVRARGLDDAVSVRGFVKPEELRRALRTSLCMVLPSRREGYGQVVVEASAAGVPSVVCAAPDNAATELVDDGENGVIAPSAEPEALAGAIERVWAAGPGLRVSTADWFEANAHRLSLGSSLETVATAYADGARG
jgi:glycosyltransferase involved in cell wall biosynthesis